jgi:hypothetical protein
MEGRLGGRSKRRLCTYSLANPRPVEHGIFDPSVPLLKSPSSNNMGQGSSHRLANSRMFPVHSSPSPRSYPPPLWQYPCRKVRGGCDWTVQSDRLVSGRPSLVNPVNCYFAVSNHLLSDESAWRPLSKHTSNNKLHHITVFRFSR